MTSSLIAMLYLADVVSSIVAVCAVALVTLVVFAAFTVISMMVDGDDLAWKPIYRTLAIWAACFATVGVITPSKTTIYAAAAVYVGGEAINTEEFQLVRQIVTKELRKMAEKEEKK